MRKLIALIVSVLMAGSALSGVTTHFTLDCREGTRTVSTSGENLRYDAGWYANGSQARITDNGANVVSGGEGTKLWMPTSCGDHQLQLTVVNGAGAQVGSANADFTYDHVRKTTISAIEPTCTTAGRTAEVECTRCGATLETSYVLAALGHDPKTTIEAVGPTCTATGHTAEVKCSRCGLVFETSQSLAALGHSETITKSAVEPTSGNTGMTEEVKCSRCGDVLQAAEVIPALGYIRNVTARQLWPHKKVEVCYEIAEDIGEVADENAALVLTCGNNTAKTVLGDTRCVPGLHRVVWDMDSDGVMVNQSDAKFVVGYGDGSSTVDVPVVKSGTWSSKVATPSSWTASANNVIRDITPIFSGARYDEPGRVSSSAPLSRLTDGVVNVKGECR